MHAETLLEDAVFDKRAIRAIVVTQRTVADLGLPDGVTLPQILDGAQQQGLLLCPADTGPYLRMALSEQATSLDSVMSSGRAPTGAITVAAETLSDDNDYPKGFYLRVVDGQAWLRGYRCDDEHPWSADDRFVFRWPRTLIELGPTQADGRAQAVPVKDSSSVWYGESGASQPRECQDGILDPWKTQYPDSPLRLRPRAGLSPRATNIASARCHFLTSS